MPKVNKNLDVNVRVTINKRFISDNAVKTILSNTHDWNTSNANYTGKTTARSVVNGKVIYDVVLDDAIDHTIKISEGCIKYLGPITARSETKHAINKETFGLAEASGWTHTRVCFDSRLCGRADGYVDLNSHLNMDNKGSGSPLDYFLFFLPMNHLNSIIDHINTHARSFGQWEDLTKHEYMTWIALLSVMTVVRLLDIQAYWRLGSSNFYLSNLNFTEYMSFTRFNDILKMHAFEIPSQQAETNDSLFQTKSTIEAFNTHMAECITPGKYLVIDELTNQQYFDKGFKALADNHSHCILRIDTFGDPSSDESDDDPGMKKLIATVNRLVEPWYETRRTIIADSSFGSPDMILMLLKYGLYSIMQISAKRSRWLHGMPQTDIAERVEEEPGSYFAMEKHSEYGRFFVCAYREKRVKAFIASCSTTILTGERSLRASDGATVTIQQPSVVQEYATQKMSYISANEVLDTLNSYHKILSAQRKEMGFFGFFLDLCQANAYNAFKVFSADGASMDFASFKDKMAYEMLEHCKRLGSVSPVKVKDNSGMPRSDIIDHLYVSMSDGSGKRRRLACRRCKEQGVIRTRVEKSCSCDPDTPLCSGCHNRHLKSVWSS